MQHAREMRKMCHQNFPKKQAITPGRPKRRRQESARIEVNLIEIWCKGMHWIYLAQDFGPKVGS